MKSLIEIWSLFFILMASLYPMAMAQNVTNTTGNVKNYSGGGMSTKSVDIANSNTKNLTPNTTGNVKNYSGGGMSTKSVDIANSNTTHA